MDPIIYKAAAQGNLEALEQYDISHPLDELLTGNKNTILHIYISSILVKEKFPASGGTDQASAAKFVEDVLRKFPPLLLKANAEDDTPLHVAARYGHASIVKVLIDCKKSQHSDPESVVATKEMIGMLNKKGDTTLHEAVRHNHIEVVEQLLAEVDAEFPFGANFAGETPLYLAAERHFPDLVSEILNRFNSPAYDGPLGRTALHAAAFWDDEGMTANILKKYRGHDLCKQTDQKGWTPLHLAAYMGSIEPTKVLLKHGREVAYLKDAEGRTALHIAAHRNQGGVIKEIISMCPDCFEVVDNEGRNALHLAVHSCWPTAALIIQNNSSFRNLLNQEDNDGNTPLHHYYNSVGYYERVMNSPSVDEMVFNKKNQTAFQILTSKRFPTDGDEVQCMALQRKRDEFYKGQKNHWFHFNGRGLETGYDEIEKKQSEADEEWQEEEKKNEEMYKAAQAHLVVAALITTVTFAEGITMPGGFVGGDDHSHPGSAVLRKSAAFEAFIITNALALMLSSSSVFVHLFIPLIFPKTFFKQRLCFLQMAFWFLVSSMAPMVLAFVTGTYAVLEHSNIAIPTCIICLSFLTFLVFVFLKLRLYL